MEKRQDKTENFDYDVVIIGGGVAGITAAMEAVKNDLSVALIEKNRLGGLSFYGGAVFIENMFKSLQKYHDLHHLKNYSITGEQISNFRLSFQSLFSGIHVSIHDYINEYTLVQNRFFFGQHAGVSGLGQFNRKPPEAFKTPILPAGQVSLPNAKARLPFPRFWTAFSGPRQPEIIVENMTL